MNTRFLLTLMLLTNPVFALGNIPLNLDIRGTSLSQLMNLKITSLSKKTESLNSAAAAVYVVSRDEIARMGVTTIPEALRYVPGVEVSRRNASQWSIGIRGFNSGLSNKLLVMIDGRSIYSTFYSGVIWEEKDVLLEDVERIEVIRGPGGAIWGGNAVNGVINIITRNTADTRSGLIETGGSVGNNGLLQARQGWALSDHTDIRIYTKLTQQEQTGGVYQNDDNQHSQLGFRLDQRQSGSNQLTVQGDYYEGGIGDVDSSKKPAGREHYGGNLLLRWKMTDSQQRQHQLQAYYDKTYLEVSTLSDERSVLDLDYQMGQKVGRNQWVAGLGSRRVDDEVLTSPAGLLAPERETDYVQSAFFQNDMSLLDSDLHLIFGTKYEHNDYSGSEWQPSLRSSYQVGDSVYWAAWSKAVRVPTRLETDLTPAYLNGDELDSEKATFYEAGWRRRFADLHSLDLALYQGDYDNLLSLESNGLKNKLYGRIRGAELSVNSQLNPDWLVRLNVSHAELEVKADADSIATASATALEQAMPNNMAQLISMLDLNDYWQMNAYLRYVDSITISGNDIDSYMTTDWSLVWNNQRGMTVTIVIRDLADAKHQEWDKDVPIEASYGVYAKWTF